MTMQRMALRSETQLSFLKLENSADNGERSVLTLRSQVTSPYSATYRKQRKTKKKYPQKSRKLENGVFEDYLDL